MHSMDMLASIDVHTRAKAVECYPMEKMMNATVDAQSLIAEHGHDAIAILVNEIHALLREGSEAQALEVDKVLQIVEEYFSHKTPS